MEKENQNNFDNVINQLQISKDTRQKIATKFRRTVLNKVTTLTLKGNLIVNNLPKGDKFVNQIDHTICLWTEYKKIWYKNFTT